MEEKRRSKRVPASLKLEISSLFKQDNVHVDNIDAPIEIINISKRGIGFISKSTLPLDYYFNAKLNLGGKYSTLYCVVKIIRKEDKEEDTCLYGAEFIGLSSIFDYIFDEFENKA